MNDISSDDIFLLKQRLAEQEALIHALQEKLSNREREIDHLQAKKLMRYHRLFSPELNRVDCLNGGRAIYQYAQRQLLIRMHQQRKQSLSRKSPA